jgi:hypothetical protein
LIILPAMAQVRIAFGRLLYGTLCGAFTHPDAACSGRPRRMAGCPAMERGCYTAGLAGLCPVHRQRCKTADRQATCTLPIVEFFPGVAGFRADLIPSGGAGARR